MKFLSIIKKYKEIWITLGILALVGIFMAVSGIGCPIRYYFGISCPGCGMSRACLAALRLDLAGAFEIHPLWVTMPIFALMLIFFWVKKKQNALLITLCIFAGLLIAVYLYRLLFTESSVVYFDIKSGAIYRFLEEWLMK
ncbi:MAG: DUF2752 domain-containing protein [Clostridia bacterium]|nr:DUF2752 domain-containing protein [Clostridia bacterium]